MNTQAKHVVITGLPGVGKTTLVKKICQKLHERNIQVGGFYTEELRNEHNSRVGFDVVALNGQRTKLARVAELTPTNKATKYRVGQYIVFPDDFENLVLPLFKHLKDAFIIDEIGKMELFSENFCKEVINAIKESNTSIIATMPIKRVHIAAIEEIRTHPKCKLFKVDRTNRDKLVDEIISYIITS